MLDINKSEVIAVVLPSHAAVSQTEVCDFVATGTMLLVRHPDGRMSLEPIGREAAWSERACAAGCIYRSQPIHDPVSRAVVGHELELISPTLLC